MAANSNASTAPAENARDIELDVTNVAHGGVFIARHEGRVVFVADTLPGERVLARVTENRHESFWRAETLEVLQAAPQRRAHLWREASIERPPHERAGGAEFGHIELEHQRELKRQVLTDALQRMARFSSDLQVEAVQPPEGVGEDAARNGAGWRTRVRLQVGERGEVGPFAARSHHVVGVESLPLAHPAIAGIAPLRQAFPGVAHVELIAPSDGSPTVIPVGRDRRGKPKRIPPQTTYERVGERRFALELGGFWQVHARAAQTLTDAVQQAIDVEDFEPGAANLDLYGGVGLLAAAVGDRFGPGTRITSVESDARATDHAGENLADWIGAGAVTARVDHYLARLLQTAGASERGRLRDGTVVLDPPRSGAGRQVVDALAELAPRQLVYVACDPVALARDTGLLRERGYELRRIRAFDLFPNTHHLEAVASFARA
ncbi:class I SAM-dependent RNA methyltransferase [Rathayibacter sp. YIM 133350]|uniref:class I SAM-dependent RNA methyltransferase n=1 Tax=Rathayibacter sp. YIM 133350 TaxID=3131992 RepID=UPI00307F1173